MNHEYKKMAFQELISRDKVQSMEHTILSDKMKVEILPGMQNFEQHVLQVRKFLALCISKPSIINVLQEYTIEVVLCLVFYQDSQLLLQLLTPEILESSLLSVVFIMYHLIRIANGTCDAEVTCVIQQIRDHGIKIKKLSSTVDLLTSCQMIAAYVNQLCQQTMKDSDMVQALNCLLLM